MFALAFLVKASLPFILAAQLVGMAAVTQIPEKPVERQQVSVDN